MEEKARLIKQKNELTNLMKTVENNIEPKRFKTMVGSTNLPSANQQNQNTATATTLTDELLDFESGLPDPAKLFPKKL